MLRLLNAKCNLHGNYKENSYRIYTKENYKVCQHFTTQKNELKPKEDKYKKQGTKEVIGHTGKTWKTKHVRPS